MDEHDCLSKFGRQSFKGVMMAVMSPLRYPGGKAKKSIRSLIMAHAPQGYSEYREPFVGGGGIYFGISSSKNRWINDMHSGLISFYTQLRDNGTNFISQCRNLVKDIEDPVQLKKQFDNFVNSTHTDPGLKYFFINRTVWMGRVNYKVKSRLYFSNPQGWRIVNTDRLSIASNILSGTNITCGDYRNLLQKPGNSVFIYCDPPYVVNSEMSETDKQYEYNFKLEQHEEFANSVKSSPHMICISYDDHELVRDLFTEQDGFFVHEAQWKYSGSSMATKKIGNELIITNYKVTDEDIFA